MIDDRRRAGQIDGQQHLEEHVGAVHVVAYLDQLAGLEIQPRHDAPRKLGHLAVIAHVKLML